MMERGQGSNFGGSCITYEFYMIITNILKTMNSEKQYTYFN